MDEKLIPLYREREIFTLFYEPHKNIVYKIQHRNKSFGLFFIFILAMTWLSKLLDDFYMHYQNPFVNMILFIIAIGITYYVSTKFYNAYYQQETKREMIVDKDDMEKYALQGLKQLKIELYSSLVILPISILFFIIFFTTSYLAPMVIACIALGATFILIFMKPLSRKRILHKFKTRTIDIL